MIDLFDLIEKRHFLTYNDCYMGREEMLAYLAENHIKYDIESTYELDLQCVFVCINKHSKNTNLILWRYCFKYLS